MGGGTAVINPVLLLALMTAQSGDAGIDPDLAADTVSIGTATTDNGAPRRVESPPASSTVTDLRGRILAKGSRGPVLAAKVVAKIVERTGAETEPTAEADDDGNFDLSVPCGELALTVSAPGFEPWTVKHDACLDPAPLRIRLVPRADLPIYETVVVAPRDEPRVDLRGPELTAIPGSLGDPFRTIESLPGVAVVAWPAPIYAVRGSNPGNTGYFLDEVQVPLLFHLALGPSVIHPYFFDTMAFYPGGYPAAYGRYAAGIVTAQTRAAAEDRAHAVGELRLYDASALFSTPWPDGKGGVAAAFRYSYTGALLSLLRNDIKLSYWDYQLRADRRVGTWRLSLLLFGSGDDLDYKLDEQDPRREYLLQFHRASLRASTALGGGQLRARIALGADQSSAPIVENYTISASAYSILPRISYDRQSRYVDWEAGLDGQAQWLRPTTTTYEAGASDLARRRTALLLAGYASASVRAGDRLTLTPGVRLDSYTISGVTKSDLGPRLSARLLLDATIWLAASGGRFSQPPSLSVQIPAAENFGLALYGLQTSWQGSLGVGTHRLRVVDVEVTGFLQRYVLTDLRDPTLASPDPLASDFLVRRDARSYGLEVMIRRPASERLHGWLAYTLSQSQRAMGAGVIGPSDWDQRHILNAVLAYRLGAYTLGARGHLNTGRPVLVQGGQAESFVRLPAFYQLDLRAERRFLFNAFTLDLYAEVVNATYTREVYGLHQDPTTGALSQQDLRVVLPSLGIRCDL
jgi:hypothetical protein